jgi:hypothetical protein
MAQIENDSGDTVDKKQPESDHASEDSKAKSKSYAEILKGFEEIEKIFKRDQKKE